MPARLRTLQARLLPHGPLDVVRQVLLFMAAYQLYRLTRGLVNHPEAAPTAFEQRARPHRHRAHARPLRRAVASRRSPPASSGCWTPRRGCTSTRRRRSPSARWRGCTSSATTSFYFVRNMFLIAFGIALIGYSLYPTAPPRFFPEYGFFDAVSDFTGVPQDSVTINTLFNPYAAVPSMHVAFALMIGIPLSRLVKWRALKIFWATYPLLVVFVIVATANHFIADAVLGAAAAGARRARRPRARPHPARACGPSGRPAARRSRCVDANPSALMAAGTQQPAPPTEPAPRARGPATAGRRAARADSQPADRVAPDAERDLADGLRAQRPRRAARLADGVLLGRRRVHRRLGHGHARRRATRGCPTRARRSARSSTRRSTASRRASC